MAITTEHGPSLVHVPNHTPIAYGRMLSQFRGKPRASALVQALVDSIQWIEDALWNMYVGTTLDLAEGHALDQWGELVGEPRGTLSNDDDFRTFVEARILANRTSGTIAETVAIWQLVTSPSICVTHRNMLPAGQWLTAYRTGFMSDVRAARVRRMMDNAGPAGKTLALTEAVGAWGFDGNGKVVGFDVGAIARAI